MSNQDDQTVVIHVNIEMSAQTLSTIVDVSKNLAGRNEKGHYQVDTADAVSHMISRFLKENNFNEYVKEPGNYA